MKKLFNTLFIEKTENTKIQFLRYIFVGGFAAVLNIGTLFILKELGMHLLLANAIAFVIGLISNYLLSRILVFAKEKTNKELVEFTICAIIGLIGLGLDSIFIWFFTEELHIYYLGSKIFSTLIVFIWNFSGRKIMYKFVKKFNI